MAPGDNDDDSVELKALRGQRASYKGLLTKIKTWACTDDPNRDQYEVETKMALLESYYASYLAIQRRMEELKAEEFNDRSITDQTLFEAKAKLKRLNFQLRGDCRSFESTNESPLNNSQIRSKLPHPRFAHA